MRLQLDIVKRIAEDFMTDACEIYTIDPGELDEDTGLYEETKTTLYNSKCMFYGPRMPNDVDDFYMVCIPLSAPLIPIKAMVRITKCPMDKKKVGLVFEAMDGTHDTYDVYRAVGMVLRQEVGT